MDDARSQTLCLRWYTTKSQENPHGHQKPNTDPRTEERKPTTANAAILATFTQAVNFGWPQPHPFQEDISVTTPFELTSATTRWAPCVPASSLPDTPHSTADVKRRCSARQAPRRFRSSSQSHISAQIDRRTPCWRRYHTCSRP